MAERPFDLKLIPEFTNDKTGQPVVEWIKNVELVCKLCEMMKIEQILPLCLKGGALTL